MILNEVVKLTNGKQMYRLNKKDIDKIALNVANSSTPSYFNSDIDREIRRMINKNNNETFKTRVELNIETIIAYIIISVIGPLLIIGPLVFLVYIAANLLNYTDVDQHDLFWPTILVLSFSVFYLFTQIENYRRIAEEREKEKKEYFWLGISYGQHLNLKSIQDEILSKVTSINKEIS